MSRYFWPIFTPPSPCHTSSHISGSPRKHVTHLGPTLRFLEGLVQKPGQKPPCTNYVSIVRWSFCPGGFVRGSFVWKVLSGVDFVLGGFCPFPFCQNTSVTTES